MARDRPAAHGESGVTPAVSPLPKSIDRHGGVEGVQCGFHIQAGPEQYPYIETGTDERGEPTLQPLPDGQKEIDHRERCRDDLGPTRVAPCSHELDRKISGHWGALPRAARGSRDRLTQAREHLHDEYQLGSA